MPNTLNTDAIIFNVQRSREQGTDYAFDTGFKAGIWPKEAHPIDLRRPWWTIGHQEETGSCVGWAVADGALRFLLAENEIISKEDRLSPRFTWMASKEFDSFVSRPESFIERAGTTIKSAADICRKFGAVLESDVPFQVNGTMFAAEPDLLFARAAKNKIACYYNLFLKFDHWRHVLANGVPIVIGLRPDRNFLDLQGDGRLTKYLRVGAKEGHALCVVGYLEDGSFILRNSWSEKWGKEGFAYATESYLTSACMAEAYAFSLR